MIHIDPDRRIVWHEKVECSKKERYAGAAPLGPFHFVERIHLTAFMYGCWERGHRLNMRALWPNRPAKTGDAPDIGRRQHARTASTL